MAVAEASEGFLAGLAKGEAFGTFAGARATGTPPRRLAATGPALPGDRTACEALPVPWGSEWLGPAKAKGMVTHLPPYSGGSLHVPA